MICNIYRSPRKEGMYLYVEKVKGLHFLPESLIHIFGQPELAITMLLTPDKKLAHADVEKVLLAIQSTGFYLQMPPPVEGYMRDMQLQNDKLPL